MLVVEAAEWIFIIKCRDEGVERRKHVFCRIFSIGMLSLHSYLPSWKDFIFNENNYIRVTVKTKPR